MVGMDTNKTFYLKKNLFEFLGPKDKGKYRYKSRSNIDIGFQSMCTNKSFVAGKLLGFLKSRGRGMLQYKSHSNKDSQQAGRNTNRIFFV